MLARGAVGFLLLVLLAPGWVRADDQSSPVVSLEETLKTAPIKGKIKRLWGGNDVKFVLRLEDGSKRGLKVIFRPEHVADEWKHRKEIAAYRLARLMRIDNVPVTISRSLPQSLFRHAGEKALARLAFRDGLLAGAMQVFVAGATDPLGDDGFAWAREHLEAMATAGEAFSMDNSEARQFARLVVFDFLQSNPDRFSGGNLLQGSDGTFWFIDNADTYYSCHRPRKRLGKLCHFDRQQVEALRNLTKEQLSQELRSLLGPKQVDRIFGRVGKVLERVDGLIAEYGADLVLF